ncbi:anthranilate phosphoribosyltransferase [Mariprofundus ferrooxydans]|uniref:anthranilate phosphoribosyltransferase n=1 Tax=Mariprofundus ferrooxydans TaxID=314344 RepID=UPI00142F8B93|nr:anthranilate phosphoribosyltransferase [Mariprofundus ferrooxydans]
MDISPLINRVARGKNGSENLTQQEAQTVFGQLLQPGADPLQLGALLIAMRMKGEVSEELAGFVQAAHSHIKGFSATEAPAGAVDLPCYAGKRRAGHAYLAAALKARDAGIPIFVHGVEAIAGRVTAWQVLEAAGVTRAETLADARAVLQAEGVVYTDLSDFCPDLFTIYNLRPRLGVRSFANSVARLLNPLMCAGQLNGFFHTPYADYMAGANVRLGQVRSLIFMGAEGEPELYADRQKVIVQQQGDTVSRVRFDEAGLSPYPREAMDAGLLKQQSAAMLAGDMNHREAAVLQRMGEAFVWASTGCFPDGWSKEV